MKFIETETHINFTSCSANEFLLQPGSYRLVVVGASGGDSLKSKGGKGGKSSGVLSVSEVTKIFVHIGEAGTSTSVSNTTKASCNGGGFARSSSANVVCSGGGSTDVRIGVDDTVHRVIVAGGGGGAGVNGNEDGGRGGGKTGEDGKRYDSSSSCAGRGGQEVWCSSVCLDGSNNCIAGEILNGGSAAKDDKGYSGGGGGLIGGAAGYYWSAGGGGSGYVFSSSARRDKNITVLNSKYFLTEASTSTFSNIGNGYAVITPIQIIPPRTASSTPHAGHCTPKNKTKCKNLLLCIIECLNVPNPIEFNSPRSQLLFILF